MGVAGWGWGGSGIPRVQETQVKESGSIPPAVPSPLVSAPRDPLLRQGTMRGLSTWKQPPQPLQKLLEEGAGGLVSWGALICLLAEASEWAVSAWAGRGDLDSP